MFDRVAPFDAHEKQFRERTGYTGDLWRTTDQASHLSQANQVIQALQTSQTSESDTNPAIQDLLTNGQDVSENQLD
jgi:hypothetical protein